MSKIKLSEHSKVGDTLHTIFTGQMGDSLSLTSWSKDKLPEYLWIALSLDFLGREKGLKTFSHLMEALEKEKICIAELSSILVLPETQQLKFYAIFESFISKDVLSPLTLILNSKKYPCFFNFFCNPYKNVDEKIEKLMQVINNCLNFHSSETSDICFIIAWFSIIKKELKISAALSDTGKALTEYYKHKHEDEEMRLYRPLIRSLIQCFQINTMFSHEVWDYLSSITQCNPYITDFLKEGSKMDLEYIEDIKKVLEYISATTTDKMQITKFTVIIGISVYACKLYSEIVTCNLQNRISARIIFRSILEAYINLKYLLLKEPEQADIFEMFQSYGVGKYKLVMAKIREEKYLPPKGKHFDERVMELYVNELKDENFLEISLGYFDKESIRNKFLFTGEPELYEIYYEYDTNYSHALWGAVRESSMLLCDNASHLYHTIPDYTFEQNLLNVNDDCIMVLKKMFKLISDYIEIPEFYLEKYGN